MNDRILIVDDEIDLLEILTFNLEKSGYEVATATSGEEALQLLLEAGETYSLLLLDVMMGGISGFETADRIRSAGKKIPIVFLTALDTESDLLKGFALGGDDYIAKPFSVKEVVARVKAVLSRTPKPVSKWRAGIISLDPQTKAVCLGTEVVTLTKTEYQLLFTLIQEPGRYFSREELYDRVWPDEVCGEVRTVDVHITRLRKKLQTAGELIVNKIGYGYCIKS